MLLDMINLISINYKIKGPPRNVDICCEGRSRSEYKVYQSKGKTPFKYTEPVDYTQMLGFMKTGHFMTKVVHLKICLKVWYIFF